MEGAPGNAAEAQFRCGRAKKPIDNCTFFIFRGERGSESLHLSQPCSPPLPCPSSPAPPAVCSPARARAAPWLGRRPLQAPLPPPPPPPPPLAVCLPSSRARCPPPPLRPATSRPSSLPCGQRMVCEDVERARERESGDRGFNDTLFPNLDPSHPLSSLITPKHTYTAAPGPPRPDLVARLLTEEGLLSREARAAAGRAAAAAAAARGEGDTGSSEVQSEFFFYLCWAGGGAAGAARAERKGARHGVPGSPPDIVGCRVGESPLGGGGRVRPLPLQRARGDEEQQSVSPLSLSPSSPTTPTSRHPHPPHHPAVGPPAGPQERSLVPAVSFVKEWEREGQPTTRLPLSHPPVASPRRLSPCSHHPPCL